ncbi:PadR family transcriptional regulator [Anaerobacillus arseniciselenatis]|uniref:PadR family transcriptional regulator n=1 Tax=Anaerobacillus arseniciselenatis TaxID=85682 RepID=A0A1S2LSI7_9BACI|nr:PadR family transcriptional regulator [Anaerobacillus arseniciselenatis]OIJ15180.1 PadR family transcriptional regulator [Anaerobacillus arseniciselenatis]
MGTNKDHIPLTEAIYYILLALHQPMHGYGIIQFVKEISQGRVELGPGTLYGAIKSLLEKGWIKPINLSKESRRKEYEITETGREIVELELSRLTELVTNGNKMIKEKRDDSEN